MRKESLEGVSISEVESIVDRLIAAVSRLQMIDDGRSQEMTKLFIELSKTVDKAIDLIQEPDPWDLP